MKIIFILRVLSNVNKKAFAQNSNTPLLKKYICENFQELFDDELINRDDSYL